MLRRLSVVTAVAAGMSIAAITLASPALAKGPSQARITGPGLAHAIVVSGTGEPGRPGGLSVLAVQTNLFFVLFGTTSVPPQAPPRVRTPPPGASLGPRYTIIYTVPGNITSHPGDRFGQVRQDLYPAAAAGPLVYTPPGQRAGPFPVTGWLRAGRGLPRTLARLGIPRPGTHAALYVRLPARHPAAARRAGSSTPSWLIAPAAAIAAAALAGAALLRRHRRPATTRDGQPRASGPAAGHA
jgi:hypothetical protein